MKKLLNRIFIDGFRGMTLGMFCTLIIGTALAQVGTWVGGAFGAYLQTMGNIAKTLTGAGIGIGMAAIYNVGPLVAVSAAVAGMIGALHTVTGLAFGMTGEPLGAFVAAYIAISVGQLVTGRTHFDVIITPVVSIIIGALVGYFAGPYISRFICWLASLANQSVAQSPIIGGMIVAVVMGMFCAMPVNGIAIAYTIGLSGIAAGAATIGCCCSMVGFAVISYKDNKIGGMIAQGFGSSVLQFPNIIRHPLIWLPTIITSAILGPVGAALLKMSGTAYSAGIGSLVLIGQFETYAVMRGALHPAIIIIEIVLMHFLLPGLMALGIAEVMRKLGWIRKNDMKIVS